MVKKNKFNDILKISIMIVIAIYIFFGGLGYLCYGADLVNEPINFKILK